MIYFYSYSYGIRGNQVYDIRKKAIWFRVACMIAGGGCCAAVSEAWTRSAYTEISAAGGSSGMAGEILVRLTGEIDRTPTPNMAETPAAKAEYNDQKRRYRYIGELRQETDSAGVLNCAWYFEQEETEENSRESVAGKIYSELSERDSVWIRQLYHLGENSPAELSERLGIEVPPVSEWTRINVSFRDGDDAPVSGYSNAREILSLASVYGFYHHWKEYGAFRGYADSLWKASHSYRLSVSSLYYCPEECRYIADFGAEQQGEPDQSDERINPDPEEGRADTAGEAAGAGDIRIASSSDAGAGREQPEAGQGESGRAGDEVRNQGTEDQIARIQDISGTGGSPQGERVCRGHVDLDISAQIIGLGGNRNLYKIDPADRQTDSGHFQWSGWEQTTRSYVEELMAQDWSRQYGLLAPASRYVRNPLSESEIAFYLNMIPEETSEKRKELVKQALLSVGCIPYYWGGKPSAGGWEGNYFGSETVPDEEGRILRGLDCSGWINWVYWTVLGSPLPAESTAGLTDCGREVAKEELQAGDILIRGGDDRHVYLFLAWADNGAMYLIHETTGTINNVTVNTYDLELPYYRNLISEE